MHFYFTSKPPMAVKTKKAQPMAAQNSFLPPENIWSALRAAKQKTVQMRRKTQESLILVGEEGLEPSRLFRPADFKSAAYTNSATRP